MPIDKAKIEKAESRKLGKIAKLVPENKKIVAQNIIKELSFMAGTLEELKEATDRMARFVSWVRKEKNL